MKTYKVLGIDPGIANTGLCIVKASSTAYSVEAAELVKTPSKDETGKRLDTIHEAITLLLDQYALSAIAVERVFHNKNIKSSISTGKVIGLCELTAYNYELPVIELTPQQVKCASGLSTRANKKNPIRAASRIFRTEIESHHIADAALCALAGCLHTRSEIHR